MSLVDISWLNVVLISIFVLADAVIAVQVKRRKCRKKTALLQGMHPSLH